MLVFSARNRNYYLLNFCLNNQISSGISHEEVSMKESNIRNWFLNDCNKIYFWKYFYIRLNMSLWRQGLLINNKIKLDLVWLKNIKIQNGQNATSYISLADLAMNLNFSTCILILQMSPLSWLYFCFFVEPGPHKSECVLPELESHFTSLHTPVTSIS